ncbi:TPA: radical SAM protein [Candidatus Woesearchaeota archaeon]|nr:radical SAM protein [Candidatus Woesearchaeota archaeon]
MAIIRYTTLSFQEIQDHLLVTLLNLFSTRIPLAELHAIAPCHLVDAHTLRFDTLSQEKAETKFSYLLAKYLDHLKTTLTGNKATYIHRHSDIPLIGNVAFGIVYRDSSIVEIKTNNACNLDCVYCSISEGLSSTKNDFVIEKDYLVEELQDLLEFIGEPVEVHIGVQGEPFLYADMENLIADLQIMKQVHTISIDTNGTLLSKDKIIRLAKNTKLQFNLSLDAIDEQTAKNIAGVKNYNVNHVKEIIAFASEKMERRPIVAPVLTLGFNEHEIENIIQWVTTLKKQPIVGIQNFLRYKTGRNPAKEITWDKFYALIATLEKRYNIKLRLQKEDFNIHDTKPLPKPFVIGDRITATIMAVDRFPKSVLAVADNRTISVPGVEFKKGKQISIEILRDKHNIFVGKLLK